MYLGEQIPTRYGTARVYSNEANVPYTPPGMAVDLHSWSPTTNSSKRFINAYPIKSSPYIVNKDNKIIHESEVQHLIGTEIGRAHITDNGQVSVPVNQVYGGSVNAPGIMIDNAEMENNIPIILGQPVNSSELSKKTRTMYLPVDVPGHSVNWLLVAIVVFAFIAVMYAIWLVLGYPKQIQERLDKYNTDKVFKSQKVDRSESFDLNGDGVPDVRYDYYGNGDVYRVPISDYGVGVYGGDVERTREGLDGDKLLDWLDKEQMMGLLTTLGWVVVGGAGLYIGFKYIVPAAREGLGKKKAQVREKYEAVKQKIPKIQIVSRGEAT